MWPHRDIYELVAVGVSFRLLQSRDCQAERSTEFYTRVARLR
jgi:hypothetical protein